MSQPASPLDWINYLNDPYAVLGVSLAADDRRILKRYHQIAKSLHPDVQATKDEATREFASQVLTRLVNPAYQRLKQDKGRNETLATLRFKVRRLTRENILSARGEVAQKLLQVPEAEIEVFYEQALVSLSHQQYESPQLFDTLIQQISELNLIYLRRKMGDPVIREKRAGLVSANNQPPTNLNGASMPDVSPAVNYAERHSQRAQEYLKTGNCGAAIQELKDALKIEPQNGAYHCLLGQAYLLNQLPGMAKVHLKQALKLNPRDAIALKYAQQLKLDVSTLDQNRTASRSQPAQSPKGLFKGLFSKK